MGNAYDIINNNSKNLLVTFASNGLQMFAQPVILNLIKFKKT